MNSSITNTNKSKWYKIVPLTIFIVFAIIFAFTLDMEELKTFINENEGLSVFIFRAIYALLGLTPIPSEPVTLLALTLRGPWIAIILVTVGNTLAALLEFKLGGNLGEMADFEKKKEKLPARLNQLPINSPIFLMAVRAIPGFGPKFVSLASGVYQVPLSTYLWTTMVANLVGSVIIVLAMSGIITLVK